MRKISLLLIIILLCTSCVAFYGCKDKKAEGETVTPIVQEEEKIEENKIEYTDLKYFDFNKNLEYHGYNIVLTQKYYLPEEINVPPMIDGYPVVTFSAMYDSGGNGPLSIGALEGVKCVRLNEGIKEILAVGSTTLECVYIPQSLIDNIPYLRDRLLNRITKDDVRYEWYKAMDLNYYLCGQFVNNENLKYIKHKDTTIDFQSVHSAYMATYY